MTGPANLSLGGLQFLGTAGLVPNQQMASPMMGQYPAMGKASAPAYPFLAGMGPMLDPTRPNTMAALQMGQMQAADPNQMAAAIQTQYNSQLQAYQQSQKQFADWAKKYEDYERQQQQYQME